MIHRLCSESFRLLLDLTIVKHFGRKFVLIPGWDNVSAAALILMHSPQPGVPSLSCWILQQRTISVTVNAVESATEVGTQLSVRHVVKIMSGLHIRHVVKIIRNSFLFPDMFTKMCHSEMYVLGWKIHSTNLWNAIWVHYWIQKYDTVKLNSIK